MNGVVSTPGARFAGRDVKYFYLNTLLKKKRYGKVRAKYIPEETIKKNQLEQYIEDDGWIHYEIGKWMYGIPEAGRLAKRSVKSKTEKIWLHRRDTHTRILETPVEAYQLDTDSRCLWFQIHKQTIRGKTAKNNVAVVRDENGLSRNELWRYYTQV